MRATHLDLKEGYLQCVGTIAWEKDGAFMDTIIATLKDYFGDILNWVPADYFFPKVLKTCLDLILSNYVDSFFAIPWWMDFKIATTLFTR